MNTDRTLLLVTVAFVLAAREPLISQDRAVRLRVPSASGEPGEEVAIEFRASMAEPLQAMVIQFDASRSRAEFVRTEVSGTSAAHVPPRGVVYNPRYFKGGYLTGVVALRGNGVPPLPPGEDVLLVKAMVRIGAEAQPGSNPIEVISVDAAWASITDGERVVVSLEEVGSLHVVPPGGPRPVADLSCRQAAGATSLSWRGTESYESVLVRRNGELIAALPGSQTTYVDRPLPGPVAYQILGVRGGRESLPGSCDVLVETPRPLAVSELTCNPIDGGVLINWANGQPYDAVAVLRNGRAVAELQGSSRSFLDPIASSLFTVYTVRGQQAGIDSLPAACKLNEFSGAFIFRAEEARAQAGAAAVPVRIFATYPQDIQGFQVSLRADPRLARLRELRLAGTVTEARGYDFFAAREGRPGEMVGGVILGLLEAQALPAAGDQHLLTALVDVSPQAPAGTSVAVEFFRDQRVPGATNVLSVGEAGSPQVHDVSPETHSGAILVGESPVPEVEDARAEEIAGGPAPGSPQGGGGAAAASPQAGIVLRWRNVVAYESVRIDRDGVPLAEVPGGRDVHLDEDPGPGVHRYRIVSRKDGAESFPVVVTALPTAVPGTFLRGDANSDRRLGIADSSAIIQHLLRRGPQPRCLDAADADDDGRLAITDAITLLFYLFLGDDPLPLPGPDAAWFDPTPDSLSCE